MQFPGPCLTIEFIVRLDWQKLHALALAEVKATLAALPEPLRDRAQPLPVTFERRPNAAQRRDGVEPDTLGVFVGPEFACEETAALPLPPQIILYLENIWELVGAEEEFFREEVHTTYLHELGHYLGLDEDDLFERGLE
jgi:predicted Zn-dependent protease with MMP-like domain